MAMEDLIPIVNKLQDVFSAIGQTPIDLPQIVVIGSQSAGKSSVLENVVGRDFLPRGTGIVTRRPLVLQLYNTAGSAGGKRGGSAGSAGPAGGGAVASSSSAPPTPPRGDSGYTVTGRQDTTSGGLVGGRVAAFGGSSNGSVLPGAAPRTPGRTGRGGPGAGGGVTPPSSPKPPTPEREWGEFLHLPGQKFFNFAEIREEIVRETDRLTGSNKGISAKSINLRIYSPFVLNLTMVDLPGITKVATGDQPPDIEDQIRAMCLQYIKNPNAIILSVTSANTDLANSDALKMAREVDPKGDRTVGVLTKIDLMDPGTDAGDMLDNRVIPLKRGFVGVINRGQKDIDDGVSIRQALQKEAAYFRDHPSYKGLDKRVGTANLSKTLNQILMHHIRDCLPEIKSKLNVMMQSVSQELAELGESTDCVSGASLTATLLTLLSNFASNFHAAVDGRGSSPDGIEMNELYGGARISYIFHEIFSQSLATIDPFEGLTDQDIRTAIYNANGTRPSLFVPEMSFDLLVRKQIARLEQPGLQCADLVFDEMQRIAAQCEGTELTRFPCLRDRIVEVNHQLLRKCMNPTQVMIANLIKLELAYINTSHPDFIGGSRAIAEVMERNRTPNGGANMGSGTEPMGNISPARGGAGFGPGPRGIGQQPWGGLPDSRNSGSSNDEKQGRQTPQMVKLPQVGGGGCRRREGGWGSFQAFGRSGGLSGVDHDAGERRRPIRLVQLWAPDTAASVRFSHSACFLGPWLTLTNNFSTTVAKETPDLVPKTIMHFLVNEVINRLQNELVSTLYKEDLTGELMRETDDVAERRRISRDMLSLLKKAVGIVSEVRDFNPFLG
ncbi:unnamed protein product [Scytosiphon promiscuus]